MEKVYYHVNFRDGYLTGAKTFIKKKDFEDFIYIKNKTCLKLTESDPLVLEPGFEYTEFLELESCFLIKEISSEDYNNLKKFNYDNFGYFPITEMKSYMNEKIKGENK